MMDFMEHSGRRAHVWTVRAAWFRQMLISHQWYLRGAYASKFFGGHEYMMTRMRQEGDFLVYRIARKEDFWAEISRRERDASARKRRESLRVIGADDVLPSPDIEPEYSRWSCIPTRTLSEIRADLMRQYPTLTLDELEGMGC